MKKLTGWLALAGLLTLGAASAQMTSAGLKAGTTITNSATLTGTDDTGSPYSQGSNTVIATVAQVYGVLVTPDGTTAVPGESVVTQPGSDGVLTFVLKNTGNGPDTYDLSLINQTAFDNSATVIYLDSNNSGSLDPLDSVVSLAAGSGTRAGSLGGQVLQPDASVRMFVVYPVPADAPAGTKYDFTLTGTSAGDSNVQDLNQLSRITVGTRVSMSLTPPSLSEQTTVDVPVVFTHTLENTGNAPLTNNVVLTKSSATPAGTTVTYSIGNDAVYHATPQAAWDAWLVINPSGLPQAGTVALRVKVDPVDTAVARDVATVQTQGYLNDVTSATLVNGTPSTSPQSIVDNVTVLRAVTTINKAQSTCTVTADGQHLNCGTPQTAQISVDPCQVLAYTVVAGNSGNGDLRQARIRDTLPPNLLLVGASAWTSAPGLNAYVSLDAGATWTISSGSLVLGAGQQNAVVMAALDSNNDGSITSADLLPAGEQLQLQLFGQVPGGASCTRPTPVDVAFPVIVVGS